MDFGYVGDEFVGGVDVEFGFGGVGWGVVVELGEFFFGEVLLFCFGCCSYLVVFDVL